MIPRDVGLQATENKALSRGIIGKSAPPLTEITIRKSQASVKKAARKARADVFSPENLESQSHRTPLGVAGPRGAGQASSSLQCSVCSSALAARAGSSEHRYAVRSAGPGQCGGWRGRQSDC